MKSSMSLRIIVLLASIAIVVPRAFGGEAPGLAGHWVGAIQIPGAELKIDVDFRDGAAEWKADITIPAQGAKDLPLGNVRVDGKSVAFDLPDVPGNPTFNGSLGDDGKSISGFFSQGGQTFPFKLERSPEPGASAKEKLKDFGDFVNNALKDWMVPGLAVGVVVNGEVVYAQGFGKRDVEKGLPVTSKTLFAIGSATKAFTSFAMGTLVDEGKLEWDKPVVSFLPGFKLYDEYASSHITPRDLVTHRSGLPRHDLAWYNNTSLSRKEMVARLPYYKPNKDLRETFQYNNMMFLTAGYLVGELTGGTWEEAVRSRVLDPLGMTETNFSVNDSQKTSDFALPYEFKDDVVKRMSFRNIDNVGPAGSINSNIEDMTRWLAVHLNKGKLGDGRAINESTITDMHSPHMAIASLPDPEEPEVSPSSYGMGWFVQTYRGHYWVHHGGAIDGFIALVSFFPNDGVGIVVFANLNGSALPGLVTRHAADRVLGLEPKDWNGKALAKWEAGKAAGKEAKKKKDTVRKPGTKPAHSLKEYAGEYGNPGYGLLKVETKDEKLIVTFNNIVTPFEHWHYEVFNGLENPDDHTFENLRIQFSTNFKGDVDRVAVPLEPAVDEIVFTRRPDPKLSDPAYLGRFVGVYELAGEEVTFAIQGNALTLTVPGQPLYELVADRGDEFNLKGVSGYSVRFAADSEGSMTAFLNQPNGVFELKKKGH